MISLWKGQITPDEGDKRTMREIAEDVAQAHRLTLDELKTPTHARRIAWPRQEAMAAMHATGRYSYPQIGRFFGMDHTSVIHGVRAHKARQQGAQPDCAGSRGVEHISAPVGRVMNSLSQKVSK